MKDSQWNHERTASGIQNQADYSLKYTTSPKKSYVVEPKEGKIDYSKAKRDGGFVGKIEK